MTKEERMERVEFLFKTRWAGSRRIKKCLLKLAVG